MCWNCTLIYTPPLRSKSAIVAQFVELKQFQRNESGAQNPSCYWQEEDVQKGKGTVQTVFAETAVHFRHACFGTYVLGQGVQGAECLARFGKELAVGVYVQMDEAVLQVEDGLAQTFKVGKEERVLVAVLPYAFVKARLCEGIPPDHEVLCGERVKGMCLAVFHGKASCCHRLVGPPQLAPFGTFRGILHAPVVNIGRVLYCGIHVVLDVIGTVHLGVAIDEENPFAGREFEKPVAYPGASDVLRRFVDAALLHGGYPLEGLCRHL